MPQHEIKKPTNTFFPHFTAAFVTTGAAHPLRVLLNRAPEHNTIMGVVKDLPGHWKSGIGLNLMRGVGVVSLQSWAKQNVQNLYPASSAQGKVAGWFAATLAGTTVATVIETCFIRKTNSKTARFFDPRFTLALSAAYFLRESSFSLVVLSANDLPTAAFYPTMFVATGLSAICHKFAVWKPPLI